MKYYECCCLNGLNLYEILNEIILGGYRKYKNRDEDDRIIRKNSQQLKNVNINPKNKTKCCYYFN